MTRTSEKIKPERASFLLYDAKPRDAEAIARLMIRCKEQSFDEELHPHELDLEFWQERWEGYLTNGSAAEHALGDGFVIVALSGTEMLGFAGWHHTRRYDCDGELHAMYVDYAYQGKGVGTALLHEIMRRLKAEGAEGLCVEYEPDNPYRRFYNKHGAQEVAPRWAVWRVFPKI
jgi:GNAT superfamily N-acetyltransferase